VSRAAPASYTLSWTIFGSPTNCTKSGTWGGAAANLSSGSQYFTGVSVLGDKTYTLACSNAGGSSSDTVTVLINNPPPAGSTSTQQAAAGGFLQGSVKDVDDQVVPDVYVHVFSADFSLNFNAITRNDGSFGMSLPAGTYSVEIYSPTARSELIKPAPKSVNIVNGTVQAVALQFGVVSKTISGTATFSTGGPVTDAEVGAYSSNAQQWVSAVTDGAGKFELKVSGGTWQLGIRPKNPGTAQWSAPSQSRQVVFVNNSSFENQTVDFVIAVQGAQVNVRVVDQNGIAIQNAGIVVDTMSASQQPSGMNSTPTIFKKSDSGGTASFSVQGGTYYLRAFLPPESGYSNPDEQPIFLNAKETKDVSLVFRKRANLSAITINGLTRFDDGTPTDAFVWAWSEKGDATQIRSEADGNWKIQVAAGRWHIGAGKERSGIPYKSSELTVDVVSGAPTVEVVLSKMGSALPPPVTVSQEANQQIIAQAKDGAKVEIPGGAAASSGNVNVQMKPTIEAASQAGAKVVSIVYDVSITNAGGTAITSLEKEIEITIPYSDADLEAQGVTTGKLVPSYYDATTGNWVKVDNFTIDKVHHVVVVRVKHLTRFALVAAADITPPEAPTVATAKSSGNGEIAVSWVSPKGDFDHVKIYRSTTAGTLGKIVSNNISANSAKDADVVDGTKYFYTVRAVDAAGNESVNVAQVSVFAKGTSAGGGKLSRNLKMGSQGDDVATLQKLLIKEGVYPGGTVSGYFGKLTAAAVARLQEKYADEILKPNGLDRGTGIVGTSTRMKLNKLLQ
jgi:peptidoglycan hydrolase-like protein with peptidoglycan-binding domain